VIADVVPGAKIQPIRALSWRGGLLSDVAAGITWASGGTVDGVPTNTTPSKVINLSFSVQAACPNTLQTAIDDAVARGSVIVAAAGNNNDDAAGYAPGNCANVITVGATNADGKRANYSNYGTVVDASAPGETPRTKRQGTSIAAAHTAAALALIAADNPDAAPSDLTQQLTGRYLRDFPGNTCDATTEITCGQGIVQIVSGSGQVDRVYFQEFSSSPWTGHEVCPDDARYHWNYGCVLAGDVEAYSTLYSANPDGTDKEAIDITCLPSNAHHKAPWPGVHKAVVDATNGKIYWENSFEPGIARVDLDGSNCELVANGGYYGKVSIALDSTGSYLYSVQRTTLRRVDIGAGTTTSLTLTGLDFTPSAIGDLTVSGSTLYLTVEGSDFGQVIAVSLDPTSTTQVASEVLGTDQPSGMFGISVDAANDKIYWATGSAVRRATLSTGAGIETIATGTFDYVTVLPVSGRLLAGDKGSSSGGTLMDADGTNQEPSTIATRSYVSAISAAAPADGGSSSSGGSSGGSMTPGPTSPPGVTTPPPRTSLPIGAVLGSGLMLVGGELVPVEPQRAPSGGKWTVSGEDFSLEFVPQVTDSGLYEGPAQTLRAPVGGQVQVTGDGYLGGSSVSVYLVPPSASGVSARASTEPIYLGDATVAADGDFAVTFSVPASVDPGDYVLQINGWSQQASARSVNLNMGVYESLVARSVTEAAFFQGRSSSFSKNGRRKLRELVSSVPQGAQDIEVGITAVSVSIDDVEKDLRLAAIRGRKLRDHLSARGLEGTYSITIRTEDEMVSRRKDPLRFSSQGKPLTTVEVSFQAPR